MEESKKQTFIEKRLQKEEFCKYSKFDDLECAYLGGVSPGT